MSSSNESEESTDNRFDDLDLDDEDADSGDSNSSVMEPTSDVGSQDHSPKGETGEDGVGTNRKIEESSPPFGYNKATQDQLYVKEGLEDDLDDLRHQIEHILRSRFGIRNVEVREQDTAIAQMILQEFSAEDIAENVVENRGFDPDEV